MNTNYDYSFREIKFLIRNRKAPVANASEGHAGAM
jgi:hypothetical protein